MAGKAVTSLTTGPENSRRRVDPPYARPAKTASLRATDDCGGCDRARLVYVGWGGTSTAPTASPVEGWIAFDRMSGATNFKGEYLGTIIANAGGTGQQRLPIPKGWPCSRLGRSGGRGDPLAQPAPSQGGDAGGQQRGGGGDHKCRSRAGGVGGQAAGRGPGGEADPGGGIQPGESLGQHRVGEQPLGEGEAGDQRRGDRGPRGQGGGGHLRDRSGGREQERAGGEGGEGGREPRTGSNCSTSGRCRSPGTATRAARSPAPGPVTTPEGRNRGEPGAQQWARRVRRAAWGNGPGAIPAPRPRPTQPRRQDARRGRT